MNTDKQMAKGKGQRAKLGRVGLSTACACIALLTACTTTRVVTPVTDPYDPNVTRLITNTVTTLDTNLTIGIINATVPGTVRLVCEKDNNARAYFLQAALVLNAAATSGQYDIA